MFKREREREYQSYVCLKRKATVFGRWPIGNSHANERVEVTDTKQVYFSNILYQG